MAKISLSNILSGFSLSKLNANFQALATELQDKVLYRDNPDGEPNSMAVNLDMDSNRILNLPVPQGGSEPARLQDLNDLLTQFDADGIIPIIQPRQVGDGATTSFASPATGPQTVRSFFVHVGGVFMRPTSEFSYDSGTGNIVFVNAPPVGVSVDVTFFEPNVLAAASTDAVDVTYSGGTTAEAALDLALGVDTVADLLAVSPAVNGEAWRVRSYFSGWASYLDEPQGGGTFRWDSTRAKSEHNGGTIISPTVPFDGNTGSAHTDFLNGTGETDGAGSGCWVRQINKVDVTDFGAQDRGFLADSTNGVQAAIDAALGAGLQLTAAALVYNVTQISFKGAGHKVNFDGAIFNGVATTATTSIIDVRAGLSDFIGLTAAGAQNQNYQCGIHYYTNDLNSYHPGRTRFERPYVTECLVGFVVGMLPSQGGTYYAQGTVQADGVATDAPVSEGYVHGLRCSNCIRGVWFEQPNGKLPFTDCDITGENTQWGGSEPTPADTTALTLRWGEMSIQGGDLEQLQESTGFLANISGPSTLNIDNCIIEATAPMLIQGKARVRISNPKNWGLNNASTSMIWVLDDCDRELVISDGFMLRGAGTTSSHPVVKTVSDTSGTAGYNYKFQTVFNNVEFGDANFVQGATFNPLVSGHYAEFNQCRITSHSVSGNTDVRVTDYSISPKDNRLVGAVDLATTTITAFGANGTAASGGWNFTVSGTASWGSYAVGLPTIEGRHVQSALRLAAAAGGTVSAVSPKFDVEPSRTYLIRGWIKTGTSGATTIIRCKYYDYAGTASVIDAELDTFVGPESQFGTTCQPLQQWFTVPGDATQMELFLYAENGADVQYALLDVA